MDEALFLRLADALPGQVRLKEPLSKHCSFKIGGPALAWAEPDDEAGLLLCLKTAREAGAPVTVLTGGTNVLVRDGGVPGLVLSLGEGFAKFQMEGGRVRAGAALNLALLARKCSLAGWAGLEWAVGIPGSVGGGLVMNAGAHGGELKDVVRKVGLIHKGRPEVWSAQDCGFGYRHSRFKGLSPGSFILTWAELELSPADPEALKARMDEALAKRKASQPLELPNAGCVFKNPAGDSAGRMIEACGLKGRAHGGARISEKHANFVVNAGGATAADVLALMAEARAAVKAKFGVDLVDEILILGADA